jgi:hypothetical protein
MDEKLSAGIRGQLPTRARRMNEVSEVVNRWLPNPDDDPWGYIATALDQPMTIETRSTL